MAASEASVAELFESLLKQIAENFDRSMHLNVVGIRTRGAVLANRLVARLRQIGFDHVDHGVVDVTMYRDDLSLGRGTTPLGQTQLDVQIDAKPLLLVDDVLFTGRSLRAALNVISEFGRPSTMKLAVLLDRGGREVPIQPDFVGGVRSDVPANQRVNVHFRETDGRDEIVIVAGGPRSPRLDHGSWKHRHLLDLQSLDANDIKFVLDTAQALHEVSARSIKKLPTLRGRVVVNAFFEDSTRTRTSFALAAQRLGADVLDFSEQGSSVSKGETLIDTARTIEAMGVDAIVLRHKAAGAALQLSRSLDCSIINAGDGAHEHPTQGLLDLFTIRQRYGHFEGLKVAIVGDIANSRVARSDLWGLTKLGAEVILVGPPTLLPRSFEKISYGPGRVRVVHDFDSIIGEVDVINMLRVQNERMKSAQFPTVREFTKLFGLTYDRFQRCKPGVFVMHPGPMNRGVEIHSEIADGLQSGILKQVTNGLAVRMAVLYLVTMTGGV